MAKRLLPLLIVAALAGGGYYWFSHLPPGPLVLTGIVTTNDVVISSQVAGQIAELKVAEGDTVTRGQLLAVIAPGELQADRAYYEHSAEGLASQVRESEASLRFQERQLGTKATW
jgi:HlyD family secretion protein